MDAELTDTMHKIDELTRAEDLKMAIQVADEFLKSRPTEASAWRARGHLHALEGNYNVAIADLSRAIENEINCRPRKCRPGSELRKIKAGFQAL